MNYSSEKQTASLSFIFVTLLIDILGFGLLYPVLPKFIATLSHQGVSAGARDYGWLLSLYGAMQFLFSPLLGSLSDKYGRRPVLLISLFFTGVDYIVMALAPTLIWLYVGRALSGITGASFTTASAYIADVSPPEKRAQNFGLIGAAFGIGFVLGPALGGLLGTWGPRVPFWAAAGLAFANLLYGAFVLPESLRPENRRAFVLREANPVGALAVLGRYPVAWGLTGALAVNSVAAQCLQSTWVLWATLRFGWGERETGFSLAAFGVMALLVQTVGARVLLPKIGERRALLLGLAVGVFEYLAYALATQGWMVYAILLASGIGFLAGQATQGLLSRQVREDEQGALQGALTSLASLAGIIAPLLATNLFSAATRPGGPVFLPGAPFLLSATLTLIAFVLARRALTGTAAPPETSPVRVL